MVAQDFIISGFQLPLPLAVLLLGGLAAPIVGLVSKRFQIKKVQEAWIVIVSAFALASVYVLYQQLKMASDEIIVMAIWGQAPPLSGCFEIDMLSLFMAGSVSLLGLLVAIYSVSYMEKETRLTEFYTLVIFMMAGMTGIVLSGDLFTLFIFWELMGLSSYVLVAFLKRTWGPIEAGFKYLIMSATAGAFLLMSMAILYGLTGTLNLAQLSASLRGIEFTPWLGILFGTIILGFGVKAAIVPLHTWLPDAHPEAPSPISALLSGIVIETGLYAMVRVLHLVFEPNVFQLPIAIIALITMSLANISALFQDDIKRMLAYSSIAQIGYMLVGLAAGTAYGAMGLFLHVFNHSLMKGMAFLSAGAIAHEAGTRDINKLRGVGRMMPFTTLSFFIALMGLGGVPTTNGFISKFILFNSAIGSGLAWLAIVGVLNSALSMYYYLRTTIALIATPNDNTPKVHEAPFLMTGITVVMAILVIIFGLFPGPIIGYASSASKALVDNLSLYIGAVLG
jgi:proton-translocating NADH-quinone oxidoreductase chain N